MSRARDLLVVCGDPVMLRDVGGKAFAKRLVRDRLGAAGP
jgi:hypothetical protein